MSEIWLPAVAGLTVGLMGSFHCIGMCGPLALNLPIHKLAGWSRYTAILAYNIGRVVTYAGLGVLFGMLGSGFRLWGFQQVLSIAIGAFILLFLLSKSPLLSGIRWISRIQGKINGLLARKLAGPKYTGSFLVIGLLNGLLPCGLVYLAMAAAIASADIAQGVVIMAGFGFGTIPMMAAMMVAGHKIPVSIRANLRKAVPVFIGAMAIVLILRGLNLGIPWISPRMEKNDHTTEQCH